MCFAFCFTYMQICKNPAVVYAATHYYRLLMIIPTFVVTDFASFPVAVQSPTIPLIAAEKVLMVEDFPALTQPHSSTL